MSESAEEREDCGEEAIVEVVWRGGGGMGDGQGVCVLVPGGM